MTDPIDLRGIQPITDPELSGRGGELQQPEGSGESFADLLGRAITSVDESMKLSEQNARDFIAGNTENVHDVMISMQRARLSFQMMVEIRNKAIETYHEISRMQI